MTSFGVGFSLSLSLIMAIGAQNAFVLRQGLLRQHIGILVLFCALSDAILICMGVAGLAPLFSSWLASYRHWLFACAASWLMIYGLTRGYSAFRGTSILRLGNNNQSDLASVIVTAIIITFGNPHVYLDTLVLIGTVSLKFEESEKVAFALGAVSASFTFFAVLGYGATALSGIMQSPFAWRILDAFVALVMIILAFFMLRSGEWF